MEHGVELRGTYNLKTDKKTVAKHFGRSPPSKQDLAWFAGLLLRKSLNYHKSRYIANIKGFHMLVTCLKFLNNQFWKDSLQAVQPVLASQYKQPG